MLAPVRKTSLPARTANDDELIDLWLQLKASPHSRRAYREEIDRFRTFWLNPLAELTLADLVGYVISLDQRDLEPASQNRALTAVRSLLSFGHDTGYLPFNVGAAIRLKRFRDPLGQRILDEESVVALIAGAPEGRDRVLLELLYASGLRVSEAAALKWQDATPRGESGQLQVFGKGGKTRTVLLRSKTWASLESLRAQAAADAPIFLSRRGGHMDVSQIRRVVYGAAKKAGLKQKVSPHWMRHAHASHALDRGAAIHLVQATLGHSTIATTGRYLHARPVDSSSMYLPD